MMKGDDETEASESAPNGSYAHAGADSTHEIEISLGAAALGISFHSNPQRTVEGAVAEDKTGFVHTVDGIFPGSAADNAGIAKGWEIRAVSGRPVGALAHEQCVALLATATRPVRLIMRAPPPDAPMQSHLSPFSALPVCLMRLLRLLCHNCGTQSGSGGGGGGRSSAAVAPHVSEAEMQRLIEAGDRTHQILHGPGAVRKSPAAVRPAAPTPGSALSVGVDDSDSGPEG